VPYLGVISPLDIEVGTQLDKSKPASQGMVC
jgi:hypothetical protein